MQDASIKLIYNYGYRWFNHSNVYAKGWAIDQNGKSYIDSDIAKYFSAVKSNDDFKELLLKTNGHFAVILKLESLLLIAVDRGRSIPLYFSNDKGIIKISDSGFSILEEDLSESKYDAYAFDEYLAAGHVTGNRTLLNGVKQLGAGEMACLSNNGIEIFPYFEFLPSKRIDGSFEVIQQRLIDILDNDYKALINELNGRTVVIPLSGGYDSRSIVTMFKRQGYQNVICYSFGKANNPDTLVSKRVADALGYKWLFIETTADLVDGFVNSDDFIKYVDFAANVSSFYIIQDYFAVKKMRAEGLVPDDAVFMPGHSGDTLGGSNFLELFSGSENKQEMIDKLIAYRFNLNEVSNTFIRTVRERLSEQYDVKSTPAEWFDYWCMKEWNPKMFANGVRVYDYFGYQYFLPLWSKNLLEFFSNIPFELRLQKELYENTLETKLFEPFKVNFSLNRRFDYSNSVSFYQKIKNVVKGCLPSHILYIKFLKDFVNSKLYTQEMYKDMKSKGVRIRYIGTNAVKIQWYVQYLLLKVNK